jgi:crotonobetainyl-CoA:carnitine CoA-transferase CaiB-like acyl-CoA transferase
VAVRPRALAGAALAEWLIRLGHLDAAVSPVLTVPEAFARAAQSGDVTEPAIVGPLPRLSGFATSVDATSAQPDEHRDAILREVGLDPASQPLPDQALDRSPGTP